jgi:hypothetical protein
VKASSGKWKEWGVGRPKAGCRLWNVGGFRPQRQDLWGAKRGGERRTHRIREETNQQRPDQEGRQRTQWGIGRNQGG